MRQREKSTVLQVHQEPQLIPRGLWRDSDLANPCWVIRLSLYVPSLSAVACR